MVELRHAPKAASYHQLFMRENSTRVEDSNKPKGRTLFMLNIPPYVNEHDLIVAFQSAGPIVHIIFCNEDNQQTNPKRKSNAFTDTHLVTGFRMAYVVFKTTKSLQNALRMKQLILYDANGESTLLTGVGKWKQEYMDSIQNEDELQREIDEFMRDYDEQVARGAEQPEVDEDGWTVVGRKGKTFQRKESVIKKIENKSQKSKELQNFYTFQIREAKMKRIVGLRKKFEEDKKKIELMKKTRRFKPY